MGCDMCGSSGNLVKASVEGVVMDLCSKCSSCGVIVRTRIVTKRIKNVVEDNVDSSIGSSLRSWRESNNFTQKEVAVRLSEKESLISKIESGYVPSINLARKIEKLVGGKFVLKESFFLGDSKKSSSGSMTIGDMFK